MRQPRKDAGIRQLVKQMGFVRMEPAWRERDVTHFILSAPAAQTPERDMLERLAREMIAASETSPAPTGLA